MDEVPEKNPAVQNFINKYNLRIDKSKACDKFIYIRSSVSTAEEVALFVKDFGRKTLTIWNVYANYKSDQRWVYHKSWKCHRSKRSKAKCIDCDAKLYVKIKKSTTHTRKRDAFLRMNPPLISVIRLQNKHNHSLENDGHYFKVSDEIKDIFFGYFDNGLPVFKALKLHEENLQSLGSKGQSPHLLPKARKVQYLYKCWQQKKRISGVVCEDISDLSITFDLDELLKAIPHADFGVKDPGKDSVKSPTSGTGLVSSRKEIPNRKVEPVSDPTPQLKIVPESVASVKVNPRRIHSYMSSADLAQSSIGKHAAILKKIIVVQSPFSSQHISPTSFKKAACTVIDSSNVSQSQSLFSNSLATSSALPNISSVMSLSDVSQEAVIEKNVLENLETTKTRSCDKSMILDEDSASTSSDSSIHSQNSDSGDEYVPEIEDLRWFGPIPNSTSPELGNRYNLRKKCLPTVSETSNSFSAENICNQVSSDSEEHSDSISSSSAAVKVENNFSYEPESMNTAQFSAEEALSIKEEPLDEGYEPFTFEGPSCFSVLNDSSVNTSMLKSSETTSETRVPSEEAPMDINLPYSESGVSSHSTINPNQDEDQQFLMSLLPELRRIPNSIKTNLKSQIQNLILSSRLLSCRERNVSTSLYRDCRTLPMFPSFK